MRTFFTVVGALYLAGCTAGLPQPADAGRASFMLTLDTSLEVGFEPEVPRTGRAAADEEQTCRRVVVSGTLMRKKVCNRGLDREHLRNASRAGLRALRRSEAGLDTTIRD